MILLFFWTQQGAVPIHITVFLTPQATGALTTFTGSGFASMTLSPQANRSLLLTPSVGGSSILTPKPPGSLPLPGA